LNSPVSATKIQNSIFLFFFGIRPNIRSRPTHFPFFFPQKQSDHSAFLAQSAQPASSTSSKAEHASPAPLLALCCRHGHLHSRGKGAASPPPSLPPLNGVLPLHFSCNRCLQAGRHYTPSSSAIEGTLAPRLASACIKGSPDPGEAPHTPNCPPPTLYHARANIILSRSSAAGAPPLCCLTSLGSRQNRIRIVPSSLSPPHGKLSWPGAAAMPSSDELHGRPW
jgi:hypothetical protein